jgi:tetratricopeptide (TPR) repeat protein
MAEHTADMATDGTDEPIEVRPWSQVWHLPVLLTGLALFLSGLFMLTKVQRQPEDFGGALRSAAEYLIANNLEEAQAKLDTIAPHLGQAGLAHQAEHAVLSADLAYMKQQTLRSDAEIRHKQIVAHYDRARALGLVLSGARKQRLADTLVALGRIDEALIIVEQLRSDNEPARLRYRIIRRIIERQHNRLSATRPDALAELLERFRIEVAQETDVKLRRDEEIWLVELRARQMLDVGDPLRANDYLAKQMIFLKDRGARDLDLMGLVILYARSFQDAGELPEARRWFLYAQSKLDTTDALNADVLVGLGQLDLSQTGDVQAAKQHFSRAESEFAETDPTKPAFHTHLRALIGLGDSEAKLGADPEAIESFSRAVQLLSQSPEDTADLRQDLIDVVRSHYEASYDRRDFELALAYLSVVSPLPDTPTSILIEFAGVHEQIGRQKQGLAAADGTGTGAPTRDSRRLLNQEAALHFGRSAEYYRRHAHAVTITDDEQHGRSLWKAAENFDHAQLWKDAIEVYAEFRKGRPNDPRVLEATHRLGRAYMADGQYRAAADLFRDLVENHPRGPVTYDSLVPLAQCYMATGDIDAARRVLLQVVTQHPAITPQSPQYRDAVIELGELHYRQKEYADAIARLDEAVQRYGDMPQSALLRFKLADAYRQSVIEIQRELQEPMPQSKLLARQAERARRLEQAGVLFSQVITELESKPEVERSPAERLSLRNSYFYRADCAYDLGNWEHAINLYDLAAKRFDSHPASLVALVQIVNAYCEMQNYQAAAAANRRARDHLRRIPDAAFDDPSLPMSREHWRRWLEFTSDMDLFSSQASATAPFRE